MDHGCIQNIYNFGIPNIEDHLHEQNALTVNQNYLAQSIQSTQENGKFDQNFTKYEIRRQGKWFFLKSNCTSCEYKAENLNREFIVKISRKSFQNAIIILKLNEDEVCILKQERNRETRLLNTRKTRAKQLKDTKDDAQTVYDLQIVRDNLQQERNQLETEAEYYKQLNSLETVKPTYY